MGTFTIGTGLGMLAVGVVVMLIIGLVGLKIINHQKREDKYE